MKITPGGFAYIERDTHFGKWISDDDKLTKEGDVAFFAPLLKVGDTAIDVGAHMGTYSAVFAQCVGMCGTVYAFEPNQESFDCLVINCPSVKCYKLAVADKEARFDVVPMGDNIGSAYLSDSGSGSVLGFSLDSMLPGVKPSLLKIDCEGMECEVIDGALQMIRLAWPRIYIEYNRTTLVRRNHTVEELRDKLFSLGYKETWTSTDIREVMADALLEKST